MKPLKFNWAVKIAYDCHLGKRGTIISRHKNYWYAAKRANKDADFLCIVAI